MSWLNSFDPAAPRNPAASSYRDSYATNESQPRVQQSTSSHAGPSTTRPNNGAPRQPLSGPHQTGRTTRLYQPSASSGSSSPAYTPRPRPPQRTRAAPPSAALRSEDAQPNENEARTKPWEIAAPPAIGKSKSNMPPPRSSTRPRSHQHRSALPPRPSAASQPPARSLPQRPPQQPPKSKPHPQPQAKHQSKSGPRPQTTPKLSKKQRKRLRRQEQEQMEQRRLHRQQADNAPQHPGQPPAKKPKVDGAAPQPSSASHIRPQLQQSRSQHSSHDSQVSQGIRTPSPPPATPPQPKAPAVEPATNAVQVESGSRVSPSSELNKPTLSKLQSILGIVSKSPEKARVSQQQQQQQAQAPVVEQTRPVEQDRLAEQGRLSEQARQTEQARIAEQAKQAEIARQIKEARKAEQARKAEEARQAEELALYLEQLTDDESAASASEEPATLEPAPKQGSDSLANVSKASTAAINTKSEGDEEDELLDESPATVSASAGKRKDANVSEASEDDDDEEDQPLADAMCSSGRNIARSSLSSQARHLDTAESDSEEDIPLQDLLQRRSSEAPSAPNANNSASKWPSTPFEPKITGLHSGAPGMSIRHFVPIASSALETQSRAIVRNRAAVFDAAIAVGEYGKIATFSQKPINRSLDCEDVLPNKMMEFQSDVEGKGKGVKCSTAIDRVEDVSRLTSKVCGIASSTKKPLGLGNHADYPCQVSLVTVNDTGRAHRTYHLDERPHAWGVASISHFPRTDPNDASSIDFATGGIDGTVNHWHWKARSTKATTFRLHTLHDRNSIVALEHLSSRTNVLASASLGTVIGYDLAALTLGFSWNTSDHIVHLQRTPDPKLMLGVLARRDYDQFRMFDVTGRNGPISRPVISFGWLNNSEGKLPLGRGSFHPTRRAIFAHGAEDGRVRVWDMRNARDALVDVRLGDEPIVEAVWGSGGEAEDLLYVASQKGVRSVSLLAP